MAESYNILDYRAVPAQTLAALCNGLRADSRIKMKFAGMNCSVELMLMALIADKLSWLAWSKTKDGEKGRNCPKSIARTFIDGEKSEKDDKELEVFETAEDFETRRNRVIEDLRNE